MSFEESLRSITLPAGEDLSAKQYLFGVLNSSGQIIGATAQGAVMTGVIQDNDADVVGKRSQVGIRGVTKIKLGATLGPDDLVTNSTDGRAEAALSGDYIHGQLIEGGDADEIVAMLILRAGRVA